MAHRERDVASVGNRTSKLTESLLRINQTMQASRTREKRVSSEFEAWQTRWEDRREQIVQRLALIDSHLQELVDSRDAPQLSVHSAEGRDSFSVD